MWRHIVNDLRRQPLTAAAIGIVVLLIAIAAIGGLLTPHDPDAQRLMRAFESPSVEHPLGLDWLGRDVLGRLLVATRVTMVAAAQGLGLAVILGIPVGMVSGYVGGFLDGVLSRIADGFLALPGLVLALAIVGILGSGLSRAMIAVGIVLAPRFFRVSRGVAQALKHEPFIEAARAEGCSQRRIVGRHLLPNAAGPLLVQATFNSGFVISAEAALSFLGLGVQPPQASWGVMLKDAYSHVFQEPLLLLPPAMMIVVTILALSIVGDGLRDALGSGSGGRGTWT